ncbi:hypothetical protein ACOMHN_034359 [Nucella lapillus]
MMHRRHHYGMRHVHQFDPLFEYELTNIMERHGVEPSPNQDLEVAEIDDQEEFDEREDYEDTMSLHTDRGQRHWYRSRPPAVYSAHLSASPASEGGAVGVNAASAHIQPLPEASNRPAVIVSDLPEAERPAHPQVVVRDLGEVVGPSGSAPLAAAEDDSRPGQKRKAEDDHGGGAKNAHSPKGQRTGSESDDQPPPAQNEQRAEGGVEDRVEAMEERAAEEQPAAEAAAQNEQRAEGGVEDRAEAQPAAAEAAAQNEQRAEESMEERAAEEQPAAEAAAQNEQRAEESMEERAAEEQPAEEAAAQNEQRAEESMEERAAEEQPAAAAVQVQNVRIAEERAEDQRLLEEILRKIATCRRGRATRYLSRIRRLPRPALEQVRLILRKAEANYFRTMHRRFDRFSPAETGEDLDYRFSDEDSDEETLLREAAQPRQAKFVITNEQRLLRSLIFGGVTQVKSHEAEFSRSDIASLIANMIKDGEGEAVVRVLKDVSVNGRSSRQDCLLFVLAKCCRSKNMETKKAAYAAVQDICRIPTHVFQFISFIESDGKTSGWGRGLRKALQVWYNSNASNPMHLAMHITKYASRNGWSHRDVFRLLHIKPVNDAIGFIVRYAVKGMTEAEEEYLQDGYLDRKQLEKVHKYLRAVEEVKKCEQTERAVELIKEHSLVREHLRTELLNSCEIWATLLPCMPLHALLRNINKMTAIGVFSDPEMVQTVISKISNSQAMKRARMHPLKILLAHKVYKEGRSEKSKLTWTANDEIVDALDKAFYRSFEDVEPTHKRILIALDISSSMDQGLMGRVISCREAATVLSMVTFRTETNCDIVGFHDQLLPLEQFKDPSKKLFELVSATANLGFGSTDCSKPMTWARKHKKEFDAFIIYTDNETNVHRIPPYAALEKYREKMHLPNAKLIVVGMMANEITIAQPDDPYMLDVVGFDPDTPEMIREFLAGGVE